MILWNSLMRRLLGSIAAGVEESLSGALFDSYVTSNVGPARRNEFFEVLAIKESAAQARDTDRVKNAPGD